MDQFAGLTASEEEQLEAYNYEKELGVCVCVWWKGVLLSTS